MAFVRAQTRWGPMVWFGPGQRGVRASLFEIESGGAGNQDDSMTAARPTSPRRTYPVPQTLA